MAANPFQYAVSQVQKKASELFNPVGQAISRVPQQFGNYIQQTPQYQGAQMYQRAFQSPQVQRPIQQFVQKNITSPTGWLNPTSNLKSMAGQDFAPKGQFEKLPMRQQVGYAVGNLMNAGIPSGSTVPTFKVNPTGAIYGTAAGAGIEALTQDKPTLKSSILSPNALLGGLLGGIHGEPVLNKIDPIKSKALQTAEVGMNNKVSNRFINPFYNAFDSIKRNPDVTNPAWSKMLEFAKRELTPQELRRYNNLKSREKLSFLTKIEQRFSNEIKGLRQEQGLQSADLSIKLPKQLPKELEGLAGTPKTVRVWKNSRFGNGGGYDDIPVIRKEENITLYQGGKAGDNRQFWTSDKKYAEQFGNVKEKTGTFYRVDNGNRVTSVYVEAPSKSTGLEGLAAEARKYKSAEEFVKAKSGFIDDYFKGRLTYRDDNGIIQYRKALTNQEKQIAEVVDKALNRGMTPTYDVMPKVKAQLTDIYNQAKGVQSADMSFKLPVAPQVVNGKIKMRPITAPKLEGTADLTKNQVIEGLNNQSQSPLQSASGNRIPELQPKTQLLNKIDQLKQSAQQSIQEQRAFAQAKAQQLAGLSANDLKDLASLRKMVGSKAGQVGDIETLYAKNPKLMDRVLNRMREVTGDYQGAAKTDVELLDHALSLPTKGSIKIQQPSELKQIKALKEDAAIARDLVYHAEPIKRSQSKADLFDKDLKEWSDMVYKDAVASEKAKTIDAVNKLTSSIEESTNKSLRNKYVANKAGKIVTNKTGSAVENILLEGSPTWKDKPKILYIRETMDRNFEDVMGRDAPKMKETFLDPIKTSEAERIRFLNKERQSIKDLGIKARSKESGLVQQFGEKKLTAKQVLEQVGGDRKKADQIVNASNVLRQKYDTYLTDINKVLIRNGYDPIPKREDYFTHFQEVSSALERFGIPIRDNKLPTDINGLTADFKPGKNFFSNALPRLGDKTDIDAITGIDRYLEGASQQMYHTDNIQRLRLLENAIRAKFEGTTHLSNFVTELSEYANGIAGKKAMIDRAAEAMVGRNIYGAANRLKSQVGANMVGANMSSALTNFIPITQSLATTNKKSFVKGMMGTIGNVFKNDGFVDRSDFLTKRFGSDRLSMNLWDKTADKAGWIFKAIDHFTSSTIVRSKFDEGIKMGLSPSSAMKRADTWADKVLAGRSVGDMPTLFNSKTLGLLTQFQLEVNNQISFMAKDIPRNFDKKGAAAALGQLFLYSYLFNNLYEKATGRRPAFDPLGVAMQSYEDFTNPDLKANQAAKNTFSRVAQNLPFTSIVEGGRIPLGGALPDVAALIKGETDLGTELKKPLYYLLPPTGGGQIKKAVEGVSAYNQGYSESKAGRVRFPVKQDMGSLAKSALFGQWSSEEAQKYLREGASPLGDKQSNNYKALSPSERQSYMDSIQTGRAQDRQLERQKEEYEKTGNATPSNVKVLSDDVIKANLKYSKGNIYTTKDALYIKRPDTSVNKIALTNELTGNAIQQAKQLSAREGAIKSAGVAIYNRTDIPEWEKNEAYKALGTNAQEVEFKALASLPDDKQASVLYNLLKDRKWKQEKVDAFIKSDVLTNSVVGKMEDQGLINESQAKDLKAYIKSTSIKLGKVSAGSSKKAKKIKMPKLKTIKVKYSKLKIKIPKPKKYKSLLSKGRSNKYFK